MGRAIKQRRQQWMSVKENVLHGCKKNSLSTFLRFFVGIFIAHYGAAVGDACGITKGSGRL